MSLEAGKLRHRVRFEAQTTDVDSDGISTTEWETVATVWAAIEPLSGNSFLAAQATQAKATARIVIRYRAGLDASMRAVHGSTVYDIVAPPLADKESGIEYLTLLVATGVNAGG